MKEYLDVIGNSALFKGVEPNNIEEMLKCLSPIFRKYKRNDLITIAGDPFREHRHSAQRGSVGQQGNPVRKPNGHTYDRT